MMKDELERLALLESRVKELWQLLLLLPKKPVSWIPGWQTEV